MLLDLVKKNRSYRRFDHEQAVAEETLRSLIALARLTPSAGNLQPLKYLLVHEPANTNRVFRHLQWARYLEDWPGPAANERPAAYIVLLGDTTIAQHFQTDAGISAQTMLLGAVELGLGGCIVASINRDALRLEFGIPDRYEILIAIALGKPTEQVSIEDVAPGGDIKYYRTPDAVHHVPKRSVEEMILKM